MSPCILFTDRSLTNFSWECHGGANQRWSLDDGGIDRSLRWAANPDLCIGHAANQPQLMLVKCDSSDKIDFTGPQTNGGNNLCGPVSCINAGGPVHDGTPLILRGGADTQSIRTQPLFVFEQ